MAKEDPRFEPMKVDEQGIVLVPDRWKVDYWTAMGELSRFFIEMKENGRLMGTKCPGCGSVYCWPRSWCHDCYVDCEWVELSGKGRLTVFSKVSVSLSELQTDAPFIQGGVKLDEARYAMVAFIRDAEFEQLEVGMPVVARFKPPEERTGRIRDFYFVPDK